ncbi:N-acetyl-gamma-glutamyl-phosphate reductase [candidate division KSB1 bacterium]|nr:N-acetyl-gamma-glutamyl-phosphate reductase [candidate division KSB1 bacterium]MBL7094567.1 N-acetyl-gamma-glutamyl-phosphate reductase [candidate division KSB1 bacterium]
MEKIKTSIVGGSGYAGGELLRLLLFHPNVEVQQVTSERFAFKLVTRTNPNLRKNTTLKFCQMDELKSCDVLFVCLPHGSSSKRFEQFKSLAPKIIDLSADFRLNKKDGFVYGIPELHREEMQKTNFVSSAGCNATATILALYPLFKNNLVDLHKTVVEVKVGSSEGGNKFSESSHHPERSGLVRSFMPTNHRHNKEIIQELSFGEKITVHFSATAIEMVRGVLATCHVFLNENLEEKDIWKIYRKEHGNEPFIRIVKDREGIYRYPEPKLLIGTNYCDIGFEKDPNSNRLVVISAIDNLMKGAAGQALQAFNIMHSIDETTGLDFPGLHPI